MIDGTEQVCRTLTIAWNIPAQCWVEPGQDWACDPESYGGHRAFPSTWAPLPWSSPSSFLPCHKYLFSTNCIPNGALQVALVVKNSATDAGDIRDIGSIPGPGRSHGGEQGNPLQYSCLENPKDRGALAGYSPQGCKESDTTEVT